MKKNLSRRQFLKVTTAGSVAATTLGFPDIIPSSALGKDGTVSASERVVLGWIGTGGRGQSLMRGFTDKKEAQVVAVCDVDAKHAQAGAQLANKHYGNQDCKVFNDYRELLALKDVDAVVVATPDHWHALASVAALNAGKDVYCEKPLANSIGEGRAIAEAAKKNNRIVQTGSHERSGDNARFACELVRNGKLGKLHTLRVNLPCSDGHHKQIRADLENYAPEPVPDGFDYDRWLGHTPFVPYHSKRCHFRWRFILAYGGGEMTDRGAHVIDLGQLGAGTDDTGPVEIEAKGVANASGFYDVFWDYTFTNVYANGLKLIGSTAEPRGVRFEGDEGWLFIHVHGAKLQASNEALLKDLAAWKKGDGTLHKVQLGRSPGHDRNFLDCVKSRKQPVAHAEIGHRTASVCHLNNIALRMGRKLKWDPKAEKFIGDDAANALVMPKMRSPWTLG